MTISKKKMFLSVIAMMLMAAISVCGTLAYLSKSTTAVVNTFVSGGDLIDETVENAGLWLKEKDVATNVSGHYIVKDSATDSNYFTSADWVDKIHYDKVLPGLALPKDATVRVEGKNMKTPAYLYIEVLDEAHEDLVWSLNVEDGSTTRWKKLGIVGHNGGTLYVYTNGGTDAVIVKEDVIAPFNATINVDPDCDTGTIGTTTISYYAYLAQASAGDTASDAYALCFPQEDGTP